MPDPPSPAARTAHRRRGPAEIHGRGSRRGTAPRERTVRTAAGAVRGAPRGPGARETRW
ncbi:hypothetical protein Saso_15090 [Streptomyces asoensis]|uniref:Uncharacterized protein n=1 Tax=Streptomyces asoensis TaxID=249586 RepID=A0ABQ3RVG0_9ACTN|nr:hypothetical protein GCM10010496_77730 [Streptomyces asoensis]GHI59859.1 hypothetical protein Saso_15090 [Streptomyces asoensis]